MNLPKRAEEAHSTLAAAFNSGNVDTVLSMYDFNGIIVPEPGKPVSGKEKFQEAIKNILAIKGKMEIKTVYCLQTGNLGGRPIRMEYYRWRRSESQCEGN